MKRSKGEQIGHGLIAGFMLLMAISTIFPFWHVFMYAISDSHQAIGGGIFLWPRGIGLTQFRLLLGSENLFTSLRNSVLRVLIGVPFNLMMTAMLAYPLSRSELIGRGFLNKFVYMTMLFSGGLIPSFLLCKSLGLYDNPLVYFLPGAISAYNMFVVKSYFVSLPKELEESAQIEGAGVLYTLVKVILPVSVPVLAAIGMFSGVGHWNSWFDGMIYINSSKYQLFQVQLRSMMLDSAYQAVSGSKNFSDVGALTEESVKMAAIVLSVLPVLIAYPFVQKYYIKGLMIGSVKG